jgi:hypothetical protein
MVALSTMKVRTADVSRFLITAATIVRPLKLCQQPLLAGANSSTSPFLAWLSVTIALFYRNHWNNSPKLAINRELKIVYRKDKHLSRAARAFIEMAHDRS